ncbi:MICOS complex subunit MIC13 homolog QIL1 [Onthophagus taurus]|uniref:MICOS complex subunit MIC13 homolog QIL1 n=1 Tax=Onthophagus taurus TaxID=166361 RepID=UPI000C2073DA|nr:MICOS complex subunit MIC13 homolog QIL1 isoform X2 [Onthophagus taurus]
MFRFAIKCGLAGAAVYYVSDQGVWKESKETTKLYNKINDFLCPYMKQAQAQLPIEIPELPSTGRISYLMKQYWNHGVTATFIYIGDLPQNVTKLTKSGIDAIKGNEEMKKLMDGFSGTPEIEKK